MDILDLRTIYLSYLGTSLLGAIVITALWFQARRHFRGIGLWAAMGLTFSLILLVSRRLSSALEEDIAERDAMERQIRGLNVDLEHRVSERTEELQRATHAAQLEHRLLGNPDARYRR